MACVIECITYIWFLPISSGETHVGRWIWGEGSIYCLIDKDTLLREVEKYVDKVFDERFLYPDRMPTVQLLGKCCGKEGYEDYQIF
uniref:Uncharacterized protein n=1 Tax=Megaselia scalaris TaxID=36166 RepID=T1GXF8_MEGSC